MGAVTCGICGVLRGCWWTVTAMVGMCMSACREVAAIAKEAAVEWQERHCFAPQVRLSGKHSSANIESCTSLLMQLPFCCDSACCEQLTLGAQRSYVDLLFRLQFMHCRRTRL